MYLPRYGTPWDAVPSGHPEAKHWGGKRGAVRRHLSVETVLYCRPLTGSGLVTSCPLATIIYIRADDKREKGSSVAIMGIKYRA